MKTIKTIAVLFGSMLLASCALKPITSDYQFIKIVRENVKLEELGNETILIYNGADIMHKLDNTGELNIWLDNRPLGQIRPSEYVIINLKKGKHHFKLLHLDLVNIRSEHEIEIDNETKVIHVKPTISSNKLEITNRFPENFKKFKYAEKR